MNKYFSIAIDGPAGSGKSTVAKLVAKRLNFKYINSGAFYRAIAYFMYVNEINIEDITDFDSQLLDKINIIWKDNNLYLNGNMINDEIKSNKYSSLASKIAVISKVRQYVNNNIFEISSMSNIVVDGRDIGTVVLPNATVKIFLDADVKTRAKRRFDEIVKDGGNPTDLEILINQIIERDNRDYTRKIAPLKKANDAIVLDSSKMTINEVVDKAINIFSGAASGEFLYDE